MANAAQKHPVSDTENSLVLTRVVDAPRAKMWKALTEPKIMKDWFAPKPWTVASVDIDLRPGGIFNLVMQSPEGEKMDELPGCVLEVVPEQKIVWTDSLGPGFRPNPKTFMTAVITLEDAGAGKTRYTATALHADAETRRQHEEMGFHEGWGQCLDQLVETANKL